MSSYLDLQSHLNENRHTWLITGAAGFIGSHLMQELLQLNQTVVGLDNFATGTQQNVDAVKEAVGESLWANSRFIEGDIADANTCENACQGIDYVLHHAALGSVPGSIDKPLTTHEVNVSGTVNLLIAARDCDVRRFVYASSTAVYGDEPGLPKTEDTIGDPLSPYAATKLINEIYAGVFARTYGTETVGLRYFNIFGPRQDPEGPYAAVIPKWISAMLQGETVEIHGTGDTTRDFCFVADVVQANLLAATTENLSAVNQVFNVALHHQISLNQLFTEIRDALLTRDPALRIAEPVHAERRQGDIRHSLADIEKAKSILGFKPEHSLQQGLDITVDSFRSNLVAPALGPGPSKS